jgi:nitroreductase
VALVIFVHRVADLAPGLYVLPRDAQRAEALRSALRPEFLWERAAGAPPELPLSLLLPRDLRGVAAQISCQQSIAGDGAFSLGMLADFERALERGGASAYPRLFWECGAVGQVLYLEAEALGLAATGIGCFFDDELHALLGLRDAAWQSLYHFTVGRAVLDPRLSTLPAYPAPAALDSAP